MLSKEDRCIFSLFALWSSFVLTMTLPSFLYPRTHHKWPFSSPEIAEITHVGQYGHLITSAQKWDGRVVFHMIAPVGGGYMKSPSKYTWLTPAETANLLGNTYPALLKKARQSYKAYYENVDPRAIERVLSPHFEVSPPHNDQVLIPSHLSAHQRNRA